MPVDPNSKTSKALRKAGSLGYHVTPGGAATTPSGRVVTRKCGRVFSYIAFGFVDDELGFVNVPAHRLQAYQKYGEAIFERGMEVRHLNGDYVDNSADNIALGTPTQNRMDMPVDVRRRIARAGAIAQRRLSDGQVERLRKRRREGAKYKDLMEEFGIAKSTVSYIVNHKTYRAVEQVVSSLGS